MANSFREIERKYLLKSDEYLKMAVDVVPIQQGYLSVDENCTIRVRRKADKAYLTVKGANQAGGIGHFEWEKEITTSDAEALLGLCVSGVIDKERYIVPWQGLVVEVDVFHGDNDGLVLAEIELPSEDYELKQLPKFIGEQVTADCRYYNSYLSRHPYKQWATEK